MRDDHAYGPNTAEVERLFERVRRLTTQEVLALDDAWFKGTEHVRPRVQEAARKGRRGGPLGNARTYLLYLCPDPAWPAAVDATAALVLRDLLSKHDFETLVRPLVSVLGECWKEDA